MAARGAGQAVVSILGTAWDIGMSCFEIGMEKSFSIKNYIECLIDF